MSSISPAILGSTLALLVLVGSARAENRIERVAIVSQSADQVVLDVVYSYAGDRGGNVAISVVMANDGEASAHYAYRPARVERGRHRARVTLGTTRGAPEIFATNQLAVSMYVGGEAAFLTQRFAFAKTWSRPGATLRPVVRLAHAVRPQVMLQQLAQIQAVEADAGADAGAVSRRILPDGSVELRYPDGTIKHIFSGGQTITRPGSPPTTMLYQNAQPPSPPTAPPDTTHADWLHAENERLLDIMRSLVGHDEQSIQNYLEREGPDRTVYERIDARTEAVGWLVQP